MLAQIERYLADSIPEVNKVTGALDFASLKSSTAQPPLTLVVLPLGDRAAPNSFGAGAHVQELSEEIGVLLIIRRHNDPLGRKKTIGFVTLRDRVRNALMGYQPDGVEPLEYRKGSLIKSDNDELWWLLEFGTESTLRKIP